MSDMILTNPIRCQVFKIQLYEIRYANVLLGIS